MTEIGRQVVPCRQSSGGAASGEVWADVIRCRPGASFPVRDVRRPGRWTVGERMHLPEEGMPWAGLHLRVAPELGSSVTRASGGCLGTERR